MVHVLTHLAQASGVKFSFESDFPPFKFVGISKMGIWWMLKDLTRSCYLLVHSRSLAINKARAGVLMSENSFIRALKAVTNFLPFYTKILKIKKESYYECYYG
ncbi:MULTISPECIES: hypothetical protein [Peribacillus]|uniref:hypothetical protein n=1 Tax=Peribacillus TaxID=2675229 RepID=UPI001F4EB932|nr:MULTISPECIES: hypothetical protein [unclassified Peribacillus]MCK1983620.1 hypothetical protein [Peribacillus sp. Aquil_B1]MCK2010847.1 hypothetical protein [Peribacillus sp. Aquil_B8]